MAASASPPTSPVHVPTLGNDGALAALKHSYTVLDENADGMVTNLEFRDVLMHSSLDLGKDYAQQMRTDAEREFTFDDFLAFVETGLKSEDLTLESLTQPHVDHLTDLLRTARARVPGQATTSWGV
eukprot:TRINITY_DN5067_c2_g1_i1.p2 TRINITY_DN5067_c2_g1~~TRINITY_DN5067_c2_g1_i1.p2  ORF type:complete len:145 (+),score=43.11 TRINITY_DN5067_c2_g1_i1:60-437(+)